MAAAAEQEPADEVIMRDAETGAAYAVPVEDVELEMSRGLRPETQAELEEREYAKTAGLGEAATAAAEGALRGLDPTGLSSVALAEIGGEDYLRRREMREREFGALSGGVEGVTMLGATLASGGALGAAKGVGLGARAASAARAGLRYSPAGLTSTAGRLVEEGAERALKTMGLAGETAASRGALRGLSTAAGAAVEGAVYGGGAAVHEEALTGGDFAGFGEKLLAGAKNGALFGGIAGGGLGVAGGALSVLGGKVARSKTAARLADESWIQSVNPSKSELKQLSQGGKKVERILETGRRLRDLEIVGAGRTNRQMLDRARAVVEEQGAKRGALIRQLDDLGGRVDDAAARHLARQLDDLAEIPAGKLVTATEKSQAKRVAREVAAMRAALTKGGVTHRQLDDFRQRLGEATKWARREQSAAEEKLAQAYGAMARATEESGEAVFRGAGMEAFVPQWKDAGQKFAAAKWASDVLENNLQRGQANMLLGLSEQLGIQTGAIMGLASGGLTPAVTAVGGALLSGVVKRYGRGVLAETLDTVARIEQRMDRSVRRYVHRDVTRRGLAAAAAADERKRAAQTRTDAALRRRKSESQGDAYRRTLAELHRGATTPSTLGHVAAELPRIAAAADAAGKRASEYLLRTAPAGTLREYALQPTLDPPEPHPVELAKWARRVEIARDPMAAFDLLEAGELTLDHVDALRTVYPTVFGQLREKTMTELANRSTPMPYLDRVQLGALLDVPTDPSLRPERVAQVQALYAARRQAATPPNQGPMTGSPGTIAAAFKSAAQQIEGGDAAA